MLQEDGGAATKLLLSFHIHQLSQKLSSQARAIIARYDPDLTLAQWRIMRVIGLGAAQSSPEIRRLTGIDKGQFSKSIVQLTRRNIVAAEDHPFDGRQSIITLTSQGQDLYDKIAPLLTRRNELMLAALPKSQRRTIYNAIIALSAASDLIDF